MTAGKTTTALERLRPSRAFEHADSDDFHLYSGRAKLTNLHTTIEAKNKIKNLSE